MATYEKFKIRIQILKEQIKWKFLSLPIIKYPLSWYYDYKFYKRLQSMTGWEQHVEIRKVANECNKIHFIGDLTRLILCINLEDKDENMFCESKTNLLNNPSIFNYPEFKKWLENIDSKETDDSIPRNLLCSFNNEE